MEPEPDREKRPAFPSTRWSLIRRIGEGTPAERESALEEVCVLYWPPVFVFISSQGHSRHDAEDLTQEFFRLFLKRDRFGGLKPENGRLRSYLLASVRHFLTDDHRRRSRKKRGGGESPLTISPEELDSVLSAVEPSPYSDPEKVFDRLWATTVLELSLRRMEERYRNCAKGEVFDLFVPLIRVEGGEIDYKAAAERLGMTANAVRVAAHRFRQSYGGVLREVVRETLEPGGNALEELNCLMEAFA